MTYTTAFEIAQTAVRDMQQRGWAFKPGVEREAALAACDPSISVKAAMVQTIEAFRISVNPRWDGSIA